MRKLDLGLSIRALLVRVTDWEWFKTLTPRDFIDHMAQSVGSMLDGSLIRNSFARGWSSAPLVWVTASPLTESDANRDIQDRAHNCLTCLGAR